MVLEETLPGSPPSVGEARRLVAAALRGSPCAERLDEILLLLSEVVTNAVLHAGTRIVLRLECDSHGVHVEVLDGSSVLPAQPDYEPDASTGRGLGLVAMLADAHGVERRGRGKAVWFRIGDPPEGGLPGEAAETEPDVVADPLEDTWGTARRPTGEHDVQLLGVPVLLFRAMRQHDDALLREHTLIAMSDGDARPPHLPVDLRPVEEALRRADEAGRATTDVALCAPTDAAAGARRMLDVLASADERAAEGAMLTPAALPEVRWCRVWHLQQIAAQLAGDPAGPWTPLDIDDAGGAVAPAVDLGRVLHALPQAIVVGDAQNRIAFANAAAGALLGWEASALVGRRVSAIVPERLRDQHLAALTSYLVTGRARHGGQPLRFAALRADGSEITLDVALTVEHDERGEPLFVALLHPVR